MTDIALLSSCAQDNQGIFIAFLCVLQITVNLNSMVRRRSQLESSIVSVERVKEYSETPTEVSTYFK